MRSRRTRMKKVIFPDIKYKIFFINEIQLSVEKNDL